MTIARKCCSDSSPCPDSRWTWLVVCITIAASYLVPALVRLAEPNPQTVWPIWPGCAILTTGLLLVRMRVWPVLMLTCFAAFAASDLQAGVSVKSVAWFVPGNTLEIVIAALGLRYCFDGVPRLNNLSALAKYSFFAILLALFTSAFLSAHGIGPDYWTSWRIAFLSEALAFATITPVLLSWINEGPALAQESAVFQLEGMILITGLVIVTYVTFTYPVNHNSPALLYSLVPFFLWSALRFGWLGVTTSLIVVSSLSSWAALRGRGPFSELIPFTHPLALQLFLISAATPFMILTAVVEDRKLAGEELARLSGRLIEAQEEERKRIARDVHDDYSQRLAMLAIDIEELEEKVGDTSQETKQQLDVLYERICELGADMHSLSHQLHSSPLESLGLVAGVRAFCEEFAVMEHVQVDFAHENVPRSIPADAALCLFRVVQEGLRNMKRHSAANKANVRIEGSSGNLHLTVSDQGKGFELGAPTVGGGIGIWSMQERLRLLGGRLELTSHSKQGTRIDAWLPIKVE